MPELPSGTVTFLFTDIEGSTRLLKLLGERYAEVLAEQQDILRRAADESGGREVDTQGDSFFFAFASAKSAVAAAVRAQHALAEHHWPENGQVRVRMGLHTGEPAVGEERYVGLGVHRAARIGAVGHGGQVLLSNATRELVEDDTPVRELGAYLLKDIDRPEPLFQLDIDGLQNEFPPLSAERFVEPHPLRRRRVLAGLVVAGIVIVAVAVVAIALASRGEATHAVLPDSVVRVDPKTFKVTEVAQVGDAPDLIVASGGYLWVTNNVLRDSGSGSIQSGGDHTLVRIDPTTGDTGVVGGGLAPCGLAADPSGDVWVANCFSANSRQTSNITRVAARTLAFKTAFSLPASQSFYRSVVYGGGFVWVSDPSGGGVQQIDPETRTRHRITLGGSAGGLGWSGDYGDLWISDFPDGTLTQLHAATGQTNTIRSVAVNPVSPVADGSDVWVGDWSRPDVVRLNAVGAAQPHRIRLPVRNTRACLRISCVWRLAAGAGAIWATTAEDHALWRIDPKTNAVTRISLPYSPAGVAADSDGVWVTVRRR
jgi:class 3 adenylate cyclase/streptogramin lyase